MKITVLPGDGIGPEVANAGVQVLHEISVHFGIKFEIETHLIGGAAIRECGTPFPDATRDACIGSDAVLLGAVGSPEFDHLLPDQRPEIGLLKLRQALGGFANLRPARAIPALIGSSPLREEVFAGTDMIIVRELLGGLYFGQPRGIEADGSSAFNTMTYTRSEVERVAHVAFRIARERGKKLTSVDKANVLETSRLWRQTVTEVAAGYPDVALDHLFVDACAMHLVTDPSRFDVILTENLFGDILSDEAAVLTGSLGMLASATIGGDVDLYEPIHGSAPDIAGRNIANPLGTIASVAMMLRHTGKQERAAAVIEDAIERFLADGHRTADIAKGGEKTVSTTEAADLVCHYIAELANVRHAYHAV